MFYLLLPSIEARTQFINVLREHGVGAVFHYIPLHSSPAGRQYGRTEGDLAVTNETSERLVRLPLWIGVEHHMDRVLEAADHALLAFD